MISSSDRVFVFMSMKEEPFEYPSLTIGVVGVYSVGQLFILSWQKRHGSLMVDMRYY